MIEYLILGGGLIGAGIAVAQHIHLCKLENEVLKAAEENKIAFSKITKDDIKRLADSYEQYCTSKRYEISRLVNCLNNYLELRTRAED